MAEAVLTFDSGYGDDGAIGMTVTVHGAAMRQPGEQFTGTGLLADLMPFTFTGQGPERLGEFGRPAASGWRVETVDVDYGAGLARFIARPVGE